MVESIDILRRTPNRKRIAQKLTKATATQNSELIAIYAASSPEDIRQSAFNLRLGRHCLEKAFDNCRCGVPRNNPNIHKGYALSGGYTAFRVAKPPIDLCLNDFNSRGRQYYLLLLHIAYHGL